MTSFFDLFASQASQTGLQADAGWVDAEFRNLIAHSPLREWHPGDPIPAEGIRLLVGVAPSSGYDMRLLDIIGEALSGRRAKQPLVEVFNATDCKTPEAFKRYIPTLRKVFHTPVVGVWQDGELHEVREGHAARELSARSFGSSSEEIVEQVKQWMQKESLDRGGTG